MQICRHGSQLAQYDSHQHQTANQKYRRQVIVMGVGRAHILSRAFDGTNARQIFLHVIVVHLKLVELSTFFVFIAACCLHPQASYSNSRLGPHSTLGYHRLPHSWSKISRALGNTTHERNAQL